MVLLKRMVFKGNHKIQDHWEKTTHHVEGQPFAGLPVFRITPVAGEGKVKIVHKTCYSHLGATLQILNMRGHQQGVDRSPDCILTVSDDDVLGTEVVLTDPEPTGEGDTIHVQCVQPEYKPNYWLRTIWEWVKSLYWHQ